MKPRKLSKTGQLQTEYRKRGFFLTAKPGGLYIISKIDNPLSGNLKLHSIKHAANIDKAIDLWWTFATPL